MNWDASADADFLINGENVLVNSKGVCAKIVSQLLKHFKYKNLDQSTGTTICVHSISSREKIRDMPSKQHWNFT